MENIINYADDHQNTQLATLSASEVGIGVLSDMQEKLHFARDELQRMENESGASLNAEQNAKADAYFKASERIKKILLTAQKMLPPMVADLPIFKTHQEN